MEKGVKIGGSATDQSKTVKGDSRRSMAIVETMIDIPAEHERNVFGQFDSFLKKIEKTLKVTMVSR